MPPTDFAALAAALGLTPDGDDFVLEFGDTILRLAPADRFRDGWRLYHTPRWGGDRVTEDVEVKEPADILEAVFAFGEKVGRREAKSALRDAFGFKGE